MSWRPVRDGGRVRWAYDDGRGSSRRRRVFESIPRASPVVVELMPGVAPGPRPAAPHRPPAPSVPRPPPAPAEAPQRAADRRLFDLPATFTLDALSRALRRKVAAEHPDRTGEARAINRYTEAYTRLRNDSYDP